MPQPTLHLICNAHLDPVWQWRWEEGCSEALSTFGNAVQILGEHRDLIFNHNEAILYQWVMKYDPALFRAIVRLVRAGRWHISGGWFLQPDTNIPGTESLIRQIETGRQFFSEHFRARPVVAYNFDSFGHTGGLPQILRKAGYRMYIHMRPQQPDLPIPADLYRWRGVDGSEILTYRITVGLYHTERDNIEQRLEEGTELALRLGRDVPVFWGIGNHGGGATREDLGRIDAFRLRERRVRIRHSTPEMLYRSLSPHASSAPIVEGDLQRVFTGCYTSLARIKLGAQRGLGQIAQAEALSAAAWWLRAANAPSAELREIWKDHLFNDFHDILPGSCSEPAERDALELYGRALEGARRIRLGAARRLNGASGRPLYIPLSVFSTLPHPGALPVEVECMVDLRPKWTGKWHLRLYDLNGSEIPCQEEQPESLLPFNGWRRKISFMSMQTGAGILRYEIRAVEGEKESAPAAPMLKHSVDAATGLVTSLSGPGEVECLSGHLFLPLVVEDDGDAWGSDRWSYRNIVGRFATVPGSTTVLHDGPVRKVSEAVLLCGGSKIVMQTIAYSGWPVLEYRCRITWNEEWKRLKLSVPTRFDAGGVFCEVPGGAIFRPADGEEHVHGRWCVLDGPGSSAGASLGIAHTGLHGLDLLNGELRLSVLRSAAYCHEQGLKIGEIPAQKYMDQGIHEIRLLVTTGSPEEVRGRIAFLADWLVSTPLAFAHLPIGKGTGAIEEFLTLEPGNLRIPSCRQSRDGKALLVRIQETAGVRTTGALRISGLRKGIRMVFRPFEIKTLRIGRNGRVTVAPLIEEEM